MPHHHHHHHADHSQAAHAVAGRPTFSLLRLSALERVAGSAVVLGALWVLVLLVLA